MNLNRLNGTGWPLVIECAIVALATIIFTFAAGVCLDVDPTGMSARQLDCIALTFFGSTFCATMGLAYIAIRLGE